MGQVMAVSVEFPGVSLSFIDPRSMLTHSSVPLVLNLLDLSDFPDIFPYQIHISGLDIVSEQIEYVLNVSLTLFPNELFSLFLFQFYNFDIMFFSNVSDDKELIRLKSDCNQKHEPIYFTYSSDLILLLNCTVIVLPHNERIVNSLAVYSRTHIVV